MSDLYEKDRDPVEPRPSVEATARVPAPAYLLCAGAPSRIDYLATVLEVAL